MHPSLWRVTVIACVMIMTAPGLRSQQFVCWNACKMMKVILVVAGGNVNEYQHATCKTIMPVLINTGSQNDICVKTINATLYRLRVGTGRCNNTGAIPQEGQITNGDPGEWNQSEDIYICVPRQGGSEPPPEP